MVGEDTDLLRDCNNELAVKAQTPLWRFWIILHFPARKTHMVMGEQIWKSGCRMLWGFSCS
jgi:hypothetical protein